MRDREYTVEKPAGVFRIAVLGSSIDMGWGVGTEETYVNLLEDWLNAHAARRGLARRFEVLNFAVAAYSPLQRLEAFRRKAVAFQPDLVLYSATMLDTRLIEIHLCDLLQRTSTCPTTSSARRSPTPGSPATTSGREPDGQLVNKEAIKKKLRPHYWALYDADPRRCWPPIAGALGVPLACVIIPRVGKADAPDAPRRAGRPAARDRGPPRDPAVRPVGHLRPGRPVQARDRRLGRPPQRPGPSPAVPAPWPATWSRTRRCTRPCFR